MEDEKTIKSSRIFDGKVIKVDLDDVMLKNGQTSKREIVRHRGGVAVFFIKERKLALVRQYRYAYKQSLLEIPAGKREEGEDPKHTAIRELEEETGYVAKDAYLFLKIYPTPGYSDEIIYIYKVDEAQKGEAHLDPGEFLNVEFTDLDSVLCQIENNEIHDGKTIAAVYKYLYETGKKHE